ncbi:hypothetical protein VLK31_35990, partial [Variovorax sp. H27-G14]|uniref:hypothetical protein n=1 Tax=Variovorax sp. H27-G14 TaxID=3111914 RepID=UPI0038FCCE0E
GSVRALQKRSNTSNAGATSRRALRHNTRARHQVNLRLDQMFPCGAVARLIARRVLLRAAGVITAEALAASAGVVVAAVSGVGLVLLIAGIGATVFAILTTRTDLQRWAARSYFGKDSMVDAPRFATAQEEDAALEQALQPPAVEAPAPAEPAADDRRFRPNGSFGIYG